MTDTAAFSKANRYNYISADSHLEVPTDTCAHRLPKQYREWAPRKVKLSDGGEGFVIKDSKPVVGMQSLFAGHSVEEFSPFGQPWSGAGTGSAKQRLKEQDADGVDAEVLYASPQFLRLCRTAMKDIDAYQAMLRAYNDWLAEEFCAEAPDRLIGVGVIPVSTIDAAVAEMKHCKELGLRTVNLGAFPAGHRYPSPEDDRFWAAALDLDMPLTVHVSMSARDDSKEPVFVYPKIPVASEWAATDFVQRLYRYGYRGATNAVQMIIHGVFDRFPDLKIYFAENQIGWIPLFLQQLDRQYDRSYYWAMRNLGVQPLKDRPTDYMSRHCYWGFFDDPMGVKYLDDIGIDNVMWSTDFPHLECAWPQSMQLAKDMFADRSDEERWKITAGNAIAYFNLENA
jgi:predicted TIM-barrel fold metal-dependent hydrolase